MKKTFNEKVISASKRITKKHKILKPVVILPVLCVLLIASLVNYFGKNGKRYISIALALVFFFMSSSFSYLGNTSDEDLYLQASSADTEVSDFVSVEDNFSSDIVFIEDEDDVLTGDIITSVAGENLESTENLDTFSVDDFLAEYELVSNPSSEDSESSFDKTAWNLILVNKTNPIPDDYEVPLTTLKGNMQCDERVLDSLSSMLKAASNAGHGVFVCSPYRDYQLQTVLFDRKINLYMSYGYSYMEAYKITSTKVIVPGASEHQLGIAFDIVSNDHAVLDYEFGDTSSGKWLKEHCAEYGFILRYPRGKEHITSIEYEPWHFRYVGVEAATIIMEEGITLEEFIEGL